MAIVSNKIRTPDGTILVSRHRHDYVSHEDANGKTYAIDGGLDYLRRIDFESDPAIELSVTTEDPWELVRKSYEIPPWPYGPSPVHDWQPLCDVATTRLFGLVETKLEVITGIDLIATLALKELKHRFYDK